MLLDTLLLSRIQFAFTVAFHIIFPTFNLGLAVFLSIMEGIWLKTKNPLYLSICKFWTKVFALTFGMGVVSGIVMSYELGANFSGYTDAVGGVLGSLFTYEVLSAFFLEAGFLGVMLFGWNKVGSKLHYAATLLVTVGTTISAMWIMSANSWMQTPAGFMVQNGKFIVQNWEQVVFNPSFAVRYIHMTLASYITASFMIAGISAYYLLKKKHIEFARICFTGAIFAAIILVPLQIVMGDRVGLVVHEYQPLKTAAIEGIWKTEQGAPLLLFALPDQAAQKNRYALSIPYGASLINTHSLHGELTGLDTVAPNDQPYVPLVFWSFRIMVGIGLLMLLVAIIGIALRFKKRLYENRWFLRFAVLLAPAGFLATIMGWFTAEAGRQPWVVYGLLRTSDSVSPIPAGHVLTSILLLASVYILIFGFYLFYLLRLIAHGPAQEEPTVQDEPFSYMRAANVKMEKSV